jgi:hypothetical protein
MRLLDAFQEGLLEKAELSERKRRLEQERRAIAERIEEICRQEKQQTIQTDIIDAFAAFCANAQVALENPTDEVKQEVLRLLVEKVVVDDMAITIRHIIPTDDSSLTMLHLTAESLSKPRFTRTGAVIKMFDDQLNCLKWR